MIIRQFQIHQGTQTIPLPVGHNALLGLTQYVNEVVLSIMLKEDEPMEGHDVLVLQADKPFDHKKGYRYAGSFEKDGLHYVFVEYRRLNEDVRTGP